MQSTNAAKAYSTSDLQVMMQVGMQQADNANYDFTVTNWTLKVVGIWCVNDIAAVQASDVCIKPPPRIMMGNNPWTTSQSTSHLLIDNPSWQQYEGTDYVPSQHDLNQLNKWEDANSAGMDINAEENANGTQAKIEWDVTDYDIDSTWASQADPRIADCKAMQQAETPITHRFIRFWMTTSMSGKSWKYIVTYLQQKEGNLWKIIMYKPECLPIYVQIDNGSPFKLPEGCIPPQPPKPPTECEMAYILGQQVTEQWGSMLVEDAINEADIARDHMITHQQDFNNPDFVDNFDTVVVNTNGDKEWYANKVYDIEPMSALGIYSMEYYVEVTCPNGDTHNCALALGFASDCGTDTLTPQTDLTPGGDCFNTLNSKKQAFGVDAAGIVMKPKLHACANGTCAEAKKAVVCGSQLIRKGWSDNVRRSYDSNYRSDQVKAFFPMVIDSLALNNGIECNYQYIPSNTPPLTAMKFCPSHSKPYCDITTYTCVETLPTSHVVAADWTELDTIEPAAAPAATQGGFKQKLETCFTPDGTMIEGCTEVSYKLSLIDRIKACFRKELKKGGFTIEKVCLYQSVSKSFKNIADIEAYVAKSITNKKCIKWSANGTCSKHGYAPRLGLKCNASEVVHNGITHDGDCYYYYTDSRDTKANDELILRDYEFEISKELFWRAKFETSTGWALLNEYAQLMSKVTQNDCLMHKGPSETQIATCANNIITN